MHWKWEYAITFLEEATSNDDETIIRGEDENIHSD